MRIVRLSTGRVRQKRGERGVRRYLPGGWNDRTLPVNVFVIDHPQGVLLFDTGQTADAARRGYLTWWHPFLWLARFELTPADEAAAQLGARGIDPADVRWVVLSHLHTDHVGGLAAFRDAEVLVSAVEWRRSLGLPGRVRGYVPQHWPSGLSPRLVEASGPPVGPFTASYDVAADGALLLVPTPGHTPGHLSLVVHAEAGTCLLAGDLAHTPDELERTAPEIAAYCRAEGIRVLTAHDDAVPEEVSAGARS